MFTYEVHTRTGQLITRKLVVNHGYQVTCAYRLQPPLKDSILSHPQCLHNVCKPSLQSIKEEVLLVLLFMRPMPLCHTLSRSSSTGFLHKRDLLLQSYPSMTRILSLDIFDCIVHNTGVLFNDEYSPRGFKKMAATMLSNSQQRLLLNPTLYNKLDEDLQNLRKTSLSAIESPLS